MDAAQSAEARRDDTAVHATWHTRSHSNSREWRTGVPAGTADLERTGIQAPQPAAMRQRSRANSAPRNRVAPAQESSKSQGGGGCGFRSRPLPESGWADPEVRSIWPGRIQTNWVEVEIVRR